MNPKYALRKVFISEKVSGPSLPFTVRALGLKEQMPRGSVIERPSLGDWFICYFHSESLAGTGRLSQTSAEHSLMIWSPGADQYYGHPTRQWLHSWVHLEGSELTRMVQAADLKTETLYPIPEQDLHFTRFIQDLYDEAIRPEPLNEIYQSLLTTLLARLQRTRKKSPAHRLEITSVKAWMEAHFAEPASLPALAAQAGLSVSHFHALFKRETGQSPRTYLTELRLTQAAFLLRSRRLCVAQVAETVGYEDCFHFSKSFKRRFGVSPSRYPDQPQTDQPVGSERLSLRRR